MVAAHQELTVEWWTKQRQRFDLYISDIVLREAARGDELAAAKRLEELEGIDVLALDDRARDLAHLFMNRKLIPQQSVEDALHVAVATVQRYGFSINVELSSYCERGSDSTS